MNDTEECPYCSAQVKVDDSEGGRSYEEECNQCEKLFEVHIEYYPSYRLKKAPCLNGDPCDFDSTVYGGDKIYRRCSVCNRPV